MSRAYLIGEMNDPDPKKNKKYYSFDSHAEPPGRYWTSKESAEHACEVLHIMQIAIPYPDRSRTHVCGDFQVEERSSDCFLVFCDVPFLPCDGKAEGVHPSTDAATP